MTDDGRRMLAQAARLYPILRSITGPGLRETLRIIGEDIPLVLHEVPSGTAVLDWQVPREWALREAWVRDGQGRTVIDVREHTLHVVNYSTPVRARMSLAELRPRLHSLPDRPQWIPYRTAYYTEDWGFCLQHERLQTLAEGEYEVCIDATLADGSLSYGECFLPGETDDEVLVSCHVCHPSLANDNLAGIAVATRLAAALAARPHRRLGWRFVFAPVTIGAITWLAMNEERLSNVRHGFVISCAGDAGASTYKRSRRGEAVVDRAFAHVLEHSGAPFTIEPFSPYGYDERQYCSPGFDLPVGCIMRTPNGRYPQYHTSADDLGFIGEAALLDTLDKCLQVTEVLEGNETVVNLFPKGEPQLGRRGLYKALGGAAHPGALQMAMLWVLNLGDGRHDLLDIAERAKLPFAQVRQASELLREHGLLTSA